jgi:multicomponent Na+:H+ antiporter subunit A
VALAGLALAGGAFPRPFARLAEAAGAVVHRAPTPIDAAYHLDGRPEIWMALASFGLGGVLLASRRLWRRPVEKLVAAGGRIGPEQIYERGLSTLRTLSDRLYFAELGELHGRISTILVPAALLVAAGLALMPLAEIYRLSPVEISDLPLLCALLLTAFTAFLAARRRDHLTLVLALSGVGYSLAAVYTFAGGADVALVAVLVETIFTLLVLGFLDLFPRDALERQHQEPTPRRRRWRDPLIGTAAGLFAFAVAWGAFSQPAPEAGSGMAAQQIARTEAAHARDVVTAILADFRGLDTLGEISVVAVAALAIAGLLRPEAPAE